ncbi:hypothetical protein ACJX0J_028316, partial [Zea mays]
LSQASCTLVDTWLLLIHVALSDCYYWSFGLIPDTTSFLRRTRKRTLSSWFDLGFIGLVILDTIPTSFKKILYQHVIKKYNL